MKNVPESKLGNLYREHIKLILKKDISGLLNQYAEDGILVSSFEKDETVMGRITQTCKGGAIVEHIDTGSLMFLPGSQISDSHMKSRDISNLMNEPMKFKLIKLDRQRGNICCSRREVISSFKKQDKAKKNS